MSVRLHGTSPNMAIFGILIVIFFSMAMLKLMFSGGPQSQIGGTVQDDNDYEDNEYSSGSCT